MKRIAMLLALPAALAGCYVVPTADGQHAVFIPVGPSQGPGAMPVAPTQPALPRVLNARLYPANDLAAASGMVSGTVTNMGTGKGRFQLQYGNELLTGEATRVSGDQRKGAASAYGPPGAFMSCEQHMTSPEPGAAKYNFPNGVPHAVE